MHLNPGRPPRFRRRTPLLVATLALLAVAATPSLASANEPTNAEAAREAQDKGSRGARVGSAQGAGAFTPGYDISYPQCGGPFPEPYAFAIVGVNGGRVFSPNPCLGAGSGPSQLAWAGREAQLYANTGNPGPELSSYWPHGQTTPRECDTAANPGADTVDCAYDYGWNAAAHSYQTAVDAYISLGWAPEDASTTPVANFWWLDVETGNSWRSDTALNVAALHGAVDYLESMEVAGIGFYSTQKQWNQITGGTQEFADYPAWHAGAVTLRGAQRNCVDAAFTGGELVTTQYFEGAFDANLGCR
jgi:hypothetical protein